jgi:hypothetical protein
MALISQITQMDSVRGAEPISAICGISGIYVGFWISRDAWPLNWEASRFLDSALRAPLGMTIARSE